MYTHFLGQTLWKLLGTFFQELRQMKYLDIFSGVLNPAEELSWSVWSIAFKRRFFLKNFIYFRIMTLKKDICELVSHFFVLSVPGSSSPKLEHVLDLINKADNLQIWCLLPSPSFLQSCLCEAFWLQEAGIMQINPPAFHANIPSFLLLSSLGCVPRGELLILPFYS